MTAGANEAPLILVVDDDPALIRMIRLTFASEGFRVVTANDGLQALDVLQAEIAAVILDLQMPRMDGRTFYREMRQRGFTTPVVIVSAYGAERAQSELGAEASLPKPFDPDHLVDVVRGFLSHAAPAA
jgi:CheY-like chemotaxis protein